MFEPKEEQQNVTPPYVPPNKNSTDTGNSVSPFIIIIIILLSLNLIATLALAIDNFSSSDSEDNDSFNESSVSLPNNLKSLESKMALYDTIVDPYNEQDSDTIYQCMGALLKREMSRQQLSEQLEFLYDVSGEIYSGEYSHYEAEPFADSMNHYILYYSVDTEVMGPMELKIELLQQDDEPYQIVGITLNT